jgi:hypothetical protein
MLLRFITVLMHTSRRCKRRKRTVRRSSRRRKLAARLPRPKAPIRVLVSAPQSDCGLLPGVLLQEYLRARSRSEYALPLKSPREVETPSRQIGKLREPLESVVIFNLGQRSYLISERGVRHRQHRC